MRGSSEVMKRAIASTQFGPAQFSPAPSRVSLSPRKPVSSVGFFAAVGPGFFHTGGATPSVRLHLRSDLHLARKAWHMFMGCVIAFIYWSGMSVSTSVTILGSVLVWDLAMETARLKIPAFNEVLMRAWGPFMRDCERNRLSGIPHYLSATLLAIAIFPKPVALLSILFLACGDPIASLFGILYGKKSIQFASGKSLIGTAAGVVACALVSFFFLGTIPLSSGSFWVLTAVGALAGGMAELVPLDVDDNFSIPVISGFVLWLTFIVLGI